MEDEEHNILVLLLPPVVAILRCSHLFVVVVAVVTRKNETPNHKIPKLVLSSACQGPRGLIPSLRGPPPPRPGCGSEQIAE